MQIYNDDELRKLVEKLNGLYPSFYEWRLTKARKEHEDEFGDKILEGQLYFKRELLQEFTNTLFDAGWNKGTNIDPGFADN